MQHAPFDVKRLAGGIGAELSGLNLADDLDDDIIAAIRQAWLEHVVIVFREQDLSPARFQAFAERFGELDEYPMVKGIEGFPKIIAVTKLPHERINFGGLWHTDTMYLEKPPMASMLLAREVPPYGGDTLFANQYLAYETLSPGMQRMLEGMVSVNSSAKADATRTREDRLAEGSKDDTRRDYVSEHPVIRTHPETGRKSLFINGGHTVRFKDMTEEESAPILQYLHQHQVRPEFTCRLSWQPGTLAFWDNRCGLHNPINDYHGYKRVMHRITLAGDTPR